MEAPVKLPPLACASPGAASVATATPSATSIDEDGVSQLAAACCPTSGALLHGGCSTTKLGLSASCSVVGGSWPRGEGVGGKRTSPAAAPPLLLHRDDPMTPRPAAHGTKPSGCERAKRPGQQRRPSWCCIAWRAAEHSSIRCVVAT
jgi:hypothetical protein